MQQLQQPGTSRSSRDARRTVSGSQQTGSPDRLEAMRSSLSPPPQLLNSLRECLLAVLTLHPRSLPAAPQMAKGDKRQEVCTREYTINLGKRLHGMTFKKKAPRAIKEITKARCFALIAALLPSLSSLTAAAAADGGMLRPCCARLAERWSSKAAAAGRPCRRAAHLPLRSPAPRHACRWCSLRRR